MDAEKLTEIGLPILEYEIIPTVVTTTQWLHNRPEATVISISGGLSSVRSERLVSESLKEHKRSKS